MNIYTRGFRPTYLYIKQHKVTGLLYFGKTTKSEQYLTETYKGGGKYWKDHLKVHGNEVETVWYCLFTDKDELTKFALHCSKQWDIVKAVDSNGKKIWANEKPENGLDGGHMGRSWTPEELKIFREKQKGKSKASKGKKRKPFSEEHRAKLREARARQVMKPRSEESKSRSRAARKLYLDKQKVDI